MCKFEKGKLVYCLDRIKCIVVKGYTSKYYKDLLKDGYDGYDIELADKIEEFYWEEDIFNTKEEAINALHTGLKIEDIQDNINKEEEKLKYYKDLLNYYIEGEN